jgi:hypothetical protein
MRLYALVLELLATYLDHMFTHPGARQSPLQRASSNASLPFAKGLNPHHES